MPLDRHVPSFVPALARALVVTAALCSATPGVAQLDPLTPASTGGVVQIDRDLAKLVAHQRVLVIGAHPDDEDTSLLAFASRGLGAEAAYLALSRGEGGQNVVGPQLGADLGLIRTQELLAARRVDGARQFFTRAFDFGFTSSLEETLRFWPKQELLLDTVRIIRRFRPQVVVSIFPNDGRGGHGQHQAAGLVAHEAFKLAGDPKAFPELAKEGLQPWKPQALYRSAWFNREEATMTLSLAGIEPASGKSIYQLAMESRGRHRSQSMGRLQELGGKDTRLAWVAGGAGREGTTLFAGIDTHLQAIATLLPDGALRGEIATELDLAEGAARQARARLTPQDPRAVGPLLREVLMHLRLARQRAAGALKIATAPAVVELIDEKVAAAERALAEASGIAVDAAADRERVVPGEPAKLKLVLWNAGPEALQIESVQLVSADGWTLKQPESAARELAAGASLDLAAEADPTAAATPTVAYFSRPQQGFLYDWSAAAPAVRGMPFQPAPVIAVFDVAQAGVRMRLLRDVVYRAGDEVLGEVRRPLRAVPALEVATEPRLLLVSTAEPRAAVLRVSLSSNTTQALAGRVVATLDAHWPAIAPVAFSLAPGAQQTVDLAFAMPEKLVPGKSTLRVEAVAEASTEPSAKPALRFAAAVPAIDLPHIPPTPRPESAEISVVTADLRLPRLARIGYVRGASDRVPEALTRVGLPIEMLSGEQLRSGDLAGFGAIVIGSRAYETEPALAAANARLLDYARAGGLVLVQYQQYAYSEGNFAPFALQIARPHDRVTDETAPVTMLDAAHTAMTTPNQLGPADWEGWVQERGLYFAHSFDAAWTPLLEMNDKGQAPQRGGLLIARVGAGSYVYTGVAFFRELPAGVPGAYRLFANLLALGKPAPAAPAPPK